jgi:ribosomal protein L40E
LLKVAARLLLSGIGIRCKAVLPGQEAECRKATGAAVSARLAAA